MGLENLVVPQGLHQNVKPKDVNALGNINYKQHKQDKKTLKKGMPKFGRKFNYDLNGGNFFWNEVKQIADSVTSGYKTKRAKRFFENDEVKKAAKRISDNKKTVENCLKVNEKLYNAYDNAKSEHQQKLNDAANHYATKKSYYDTQLNNLGDGILKNLKNTYQAARQRQLGFGHLKDFGKGVVNDVKRGVYNTAKGYQLGKFLGKGAKEIGKVKAYEQKEKSVEKAMNYFNKQKSKMEKFENKVSRAADAYADYLATKGASPSALYV